jgi:hypothetical protein
MSERGAERLLTARHSDWGAVVAIFLKLIASVECFLKE